MQDRQWHKIEIYVKHDTDGTDGAIKVWWDGVLGGAYPYNGQTALRPWYRLVMPSNWSMNAGWEHDQNNHFYIDDVEIYADVNTGNTNVTGNLYDATIHMSS